MRKQLLVIVIILGLALTGCGKVRNPTGQSAVNYQHQSASYTAEAPTQRAGRLNANAVSENDFSASDTAALLSEADRELDVLFSAVNNLDDVQDADLDFALE